MLYMTEKQFQWMHTRFWCMVINESIIRQSYHEIELIRYRLEVWQMEGVTYERKLSTLFEF